MKIKFKPQININNVKGVNFLWFTWLNNKKYFISWECQKPIWIKPKIEKYKGAIRIGWILFAIGFGGKPSQELINKYKNKS